MKKTATLWILVLLFATGTAGAAGLKTGDKILRFGVRLVDTTGEAESFWPGWYYHGEGWFDPGVDGAGVGLSFEYMVRDRIGVAVHVGHSAHLVGLRYLGYVTAAPNLPFGIADVAATSEASFSHWGYLGMTPVLVGANYHLGRGDRLDFYFGPLAGYVFYNDVGYEWGSYYVASADYTEPYYHGRAISVDDDFAYGVMAGLDVDFGKKGKGWIFTLSAEYLETEIRPRRVETRDILSVDPWSLQIGFGYRF